MEKYNANRKRVISLEKFFKISYNISVKMFGLSLAGG